MKIRSQFLYPVIACLSFWGCVKEGPAGKNSLVEQKVELPGENCATGGVTIITGIDENRNNALDSNEIQKTEYVCNGRYDKETIIYFSTLGGHYTTSVNGSIPSPLGVDNFNITNYLADSISFSAYMFTENANVKGFLELYDLTNNKAITNTLLTTNSLTYVLKATTINFIKELPNSPIKLGIRLRTETEGKAIYVSMPVIKLYKK